MGTKRGEPAVDPQVPLCRSDVPQGCWTLRGCNEMFETSSVMFMVLQLAKSIVT